MQTKVLRGVQRQGGAASVFSLGGSEFELWFVFVSTWSLTYRIVHSCGNLLLSVVIACYLTVARNVDPPFQWI